MTGVPSLAAMTAFGPLDTIVALTGIPRDWAISAFEIPWSARLTITLTMPPRPTSRAITRNWALVLIGPTSGVTIRKISFDTESIAMVRSS